jgi:hypothetical protein
MAVIGEREKYIVQQREEQKMETKRQKRRINKKATELE